MTPSALMQARRKLGIPVFLLANLCVVDVSEVKAWEAGITPIPESVETLMERMRWVPRKGFGFNDREQS